MEDSPILSNRCPHSSFAATSAVHRPDTTSSISLARREGRSATRQDTKSYTFGRGRSPSPVFPLCPITLRKPSPISPKIVAQHSSSGSRTADSFGSSKRLGISSRRQATSGHTSPISPETGSQQFSSISRTGNYLLHQRRVASPPSRVARPLTVLPRARGQVIVFYTQDVLQGLPVASPRVISAKKMVHDVLPVAQGQLIICQEYDILQVLHDQPQPVDILFRLVTALLRGQLMNRNRFFA